MGGDAHVMAVDDCIQGLEHQPTQFTQMIQNGVKLETIGIEERESEKAALWERNGGPVLN